MCVEKESSTHISPLHLSSCPGLPTAGERGGTLAEGTGYSQPGLSGRKVLEKSSTGLSRASRLLLTGGTLGKVEEL